MAGKRTTVEEFLTATFWVAVAQIIMIDILLGGDNAVVIALAFYGGADLWLFVALAILMWALYLNNTGSAARQMSS